MKHGSSGCKQCYSMIRKWASSYFTPLLLLVPVAFLLLSGGKKQLDGRLVEEELLSDDLVLSLAEVGALLFKTGIYVHF